MRSISALLRNAAPAALLAVASLAISHPARASGEVNIYSYREPGLINPLLAAFTKETGIKTNVVFASNGLIERLAAEGKNSPADLLLTNESGLLLQAVAAGVTQPMHSDAIDKAIPAGLRDDKDQWFGLTRRARVVYASKDRVKQDAITYEELADRKWRGKICIRSGQHTYNVALVASMIAQHGEEATEKWLTGLKANLARRPAGGDREAVRDVQAGLCDIAVANTYYLAAMLKNPDQKSWADAVRIIFPNANDRGTHVNVSGMALTANAPNKENAVKLMEFLASPEAQRIYAEANGEYPVVDGVPASPLVQSWGPLKADPLPLTKIAALRKQASELIDRVQFDQGPTN
ncbi:MAG TPA: Fe(3+) ABC transporter substrate-binding protein [Hyphomicrobium sp.]|jgi:iron(III) transport system substrate-binding protein